MKDERNMTVNLVPNIKKTLGRKRPQIYSILQRLLKREKWNGKCSQGWIIYFFKHYYCSVLGIPLKPGADYRSTYIWATHRRKRESDHNSRSATGHARMAVGKSNLIYRKAKFQIWYVLFFPLADNLYGPNRRSITGWYGRLDKDSCFPTIVTNIDPMAKQCRVLHPSVCQTFLLIPSSIVSWYGACSVNEWSRYVSLQELKVFRIGSSLNRFGGTLSR